MVIRTKYTGRRQNDSNDHAQVVLAAKDSYPAEAEEARLAVGGRVI